MFLITFQMNAVSFFIYKTHFNIGTYVLFFLSTITFDLFVLFFCVFTKELINYIFNKLDSNV